MEGQDEKKEQQGIDLEDFLEKKSKRDIRRKASKQLGEEIKLEMRGLCYEMKELKEEKVRHTEELERMDREEEEIAGCYNEKGRLNLGVKIRNKSKRKATKRGVNTKINMSEGTSINRNAKKRINNNHKGEAPTKEGKAVGIKRR